MKLKKKITLAVLFMIIIFSNLQAQVTEEWFSRYNGPGDSVDQGTKIVLDGSNNIYVTGFSSGSGTGTDYTTIKYNSSGVQQWIQRYDGPGHSLDEANDMAVDAMGNVYVTGRSRSGSGEFTTDYATIKYSSSGIEQWVVRYNGIAGGPDDAYAIVLDDVNNVYVTGQSGYTQLNANIVTIKYNSSGVQQWIATYNGPGSDWDKGTSIVVDNSRNVYVGGGHNVNVGTAYHDYVIIKYDSMGNQQWMQTYNGTGNNWDEIVSIGLDAFENLYVTGYSTGTGWDIVTIKYNSSGDQQWLARYSSSGNSIDVPTEMIVDDAGNIYITGAITFDFGTLKYNSNGDQQWVARYDASGNFDAANSIAVDGAGNVYVTGESSAGFLEDTKDFATVKYNSSGIEQWVRRHNGTGNNWDEGNSVVVDNLNNVYVTGFTSVVGSSDLGTIKYSQPVGINQGSNEIAAAFALLQNYPNPFNPKTIIHYSIVNLESPASQQGGSIVNLIVYDALGREVATLVNEKKSPGNYSVQFDGSNLPSGIYFYRIVTDGFTETKKMNLIK